MSQLLLCSRRLIWMPLQLVYAGLCLFCGASLLYDRLRSYSIHPPIQGTKGIPCSPLPVNTLRFPLPTRVKEGKDMCLGVVLTCSMAWALTGDLGSNTITANSTMKSWGKVLAPIFSGGQPLENSCIQMEGWMVKTNYVTSLLSLS